uniref:Uncharacterized protein n=1 Tax=Heliothis virescens TaxID=7102 RepID=A0A2A4K072_HELVI
MSNEVSIGATTSVTSHSRVVDSRRCRHLPAVLHLLLLLLYALSSILIHHHESADIPNPRVKVNLSATLTASSERRTLGTLRDTALTIDLTLTFSEVHSKHRSRAHHVVTQCVTEASAAARARRINKQRREGVGRARAPRPQRRHVRAATGGAERCWRSPLPSEQRTLIDPQPPATH